MPPKAAEIFAPSFPVTPPQACTALWYKRRRGDTELCGPLAGWPSQSPSGDSVSAAASGAVCQWQTSSTDRRGSGDRPLGNVPPGRSGPEGRAKSRLPLWGALVPSGHRSALDRAGRREWTRVSEDGEGKLPASPSAPVAIALTGACAPVADFFLGYRPLRSRARARSKLFCKKVSSKNFTLAAARPLGSQNFTSPFFAFLL